MDDLALVAAFVGSANVTELRAALQLPGHLGSVETEFVRAANRVFERLGKAVPSEGRGRVDLFAASWAAHFYEDLREVRRVLEARDR